MFGRGQEHEILKRVCLCWSSVVLVSGGQAGKARKMRLSTPFHSLRYVKRKQQTLHMFGRYRHHHTPPPHLTLPHTHFPPSPYPTHTFPSHLTLPHTNRHSAPPPTHSPPVFVITEQEVAKKNQLDRPHQRTSHSNVDHSQQACIVDECVIRPLGIRGPPRSSVQSNRETHEIQKEHMNCGRGLQL